MPSPLILAGLENVRSKWGWFVGLGILLVIVGMVAIGHTLRASELAIIFIGWLLVVTGVAEAISAFYLRTWGAFLLHLLGGAIDVVLGGMFVTRPSIGAAVLTLFLAGLFLIGGAFRLAAALSMQFPGWGWNAFNGLVTLVLGVLLFVQWPYSGLWFIGFAIGLELIFRGWAWIMLGTAMRSLPTNKA